MNCEKSKTGQHCWHLIGTTSLAGCHGEYHSGPEVDAREAAYRCCFCGRYESHTGAKITLADIEVDPTVRIVEEQHVSE